ncbi:acetylcholine receptor subunit beta-type acr-3-like [Mytilus californianus]|uniref:acetylcholine receptor subunit beta-type acr-3-like n=1 Tax=Mytilus californianus TaxID=6549 RepID=UPI002246B282|nr:acetylcholine receptor subunit beta-type acr-3-like [Mytilus californianus]
MELRSSFKLGVIVFSFLFTLHKSVCQSSSSVKNLFNDIFDVRQYDKRIRPVMNHSRPIHLEVSFFILGINSVDDKNGLLSTTLDTGIQWTDEFLMWNPCLFGNITRINVPQNDIWKPDFVLRNGVSKSNEAKLLFSYVSVEYTGRITWWPYQFHETSCEINIVYFPFDEQTCNLTFIIWSHSVNEIIIKGKYVEKYLFSENSLWSVDNSHMFEDADYVDGSNYSTITLTFHMTRKANFYFWSIIFPLVSLSVLQTIVFLVPARSGEKLSFAFTLFLTYIMFLILMTSMLPENSEHLSILCIYIDIELTLGIITIVVVCMQVQLCYHDPDIPVSKWQKKLIRVIISRCQTPGIADITTITQLQIQNTLILFINRFTLFCLLSFQLVTAIVIVIIVYFK